MCRIKTTPLWQVSSYLLIVTKRRGLPTRKVDLESWVSGLNQQFAKLPIRIRSGPSVRIGYSPLNNIKMNNIIFETLVLNQDNKVCLIDDEEVVLTKKEYDLLLFLLNKPNFIHSREDIINQVWGKSVTTRTVDTNIMRLRQKLGKYGDNIYTRMGFGYGFKTK